jgi:succinate dehydrogenase / fumarate reductase flavoprotein subunit
MKHTLAWVDDDRQGDARLPPGAHYTMTNDIDYIPPKARVY